MSGAQLLKLGVGLELPIDAVTQTFGLVGKRGVGKTHGAGVIAEEMLERGCQVVVVDPIGVWWGLRSSADGESKGYPILVLGGEHGDLPLDSSAGRLVADFIVDNRASVVLDLGEFSKTEQMRFVTDLLERVYQKNRAPLQLIMDEADAFAPQRIHHGGERCFGAVDTVVRRGRARGLGVTLVTQRSAAINKDVLTQVEVLVAFRTIAPQDRAAIESWIEVHADRTQAGEVLKSLHLLEVGEAWVWSPAWLQILKRVKIRRRRTFDSSATPEVGKTLAAPKAAAAVDVDALRGKLESLAKKADEEDPRRLRSRIAQLEREVAAKPKALPPAPASVRAPAGSAEQAFAIANARDHLNRVHHGLEELRGEVRAAFAELGHAAKGLPAPPTVVASVTGTSGPKTRSAIREVARAAVRFVEQKSTANGLDRSSRAILAVLAQHPRGCDAGRLTLLAGYRWSGGFRNALSSLRSAGLIEGGNSGSMTITDAGVKALGDFDPLPVGAALRNYWLAHRAIGASERAVLSALFEAYPKALTAEQILRSTGYSWSGGFRNALSKLRTAGLLEGRNSDAMRASEHLFEGGH